MGVPSYLRLLLGKYPTTHGWNPDQIIDHLLIDANSIIYGIHAHTNKSKALTQSQYEKLLIEGTFNYINDLIKLTHASKTVYIAFDGSVPRAKMVQQRSRRYKGILTEQILSGLRKKYAIQEDAILWNTQNITPGTEFMFNLGKYLNKNASKFFNAKSLKIVISDASVPAEGEHKYMPFVRSLEGTADSVGIFSPDADQIVLAMTTEKSNIYIIRQPPDNRELEERFHYKERGVPFIYISIDKYRDAFVNELKTDIGITVDWKPTDIIRDYVVLTFASGNDFVSSLPYLKVKEESPGKSGGLRITLDIYKNILLKRQQHLLTFDKEHRPIINHDFLKEIFLELSKSEDYYMKKVKQNMEGIRDGTIGARVDEREAIMSEYDREVMRYLHKEVFNPQHPEFSKYKDLVNAIDYRQPKHVWKEQYYNYFFGISTKNQAEYNRVRSEICLNYLESLVFTTRYYFHSPPSYTWYYRYPAPPVASDIYTNLDKFVPDINKLKFDAGKPYTPFQQLMLTLPPQMDFLLPNKMGALMHNELLPYYPIGFELEWLIGHKQIYSEPRLPLIYDSEVLPIIDAIPLTKAEQERNTLVSEPSVYGK